MRKPKLRELKEAITALLRRPYTTKLPKKVEASPAHFLRAHRVWSGYEMSIHVLFRRIYGPRFAIKRKGNS